MQGQIYMGTWEPNPPPRQRKERIGKRKSNVKVKRGGFRSGIYPLECLPVGPVSRPGNTHTDRTPPIDTTLGLGCWRDQHQLEARHTYLSHLDSLTWAATAQSMIIYWSASHVKAYRRLRLSGEGNND